VLHVRGEEKLLKWLEVKGDKDTMFHVATIICDLFAGVVLCVANKNRHITRNCDFCYMV